jgi:hypothetical protein
MILGNSTLERSDVGCGQGAKVGIGMVVERQLIDEGTLRLVVRRFNGI